MHKLLFLNLTLTKLTVGVLVVMSVGHGTNRGGSGFVGCKRVLGVWGNLVEAGSFLLRAGTLVLTQPVHDAMDPNEAE